jgi:Xaa-Pro aminopeptidase
MTTAAHPRLSAIRAEMERQGLDAFIVPRADEHQGEYVPASAERLAWATGFTGSAGAAVIMRDRAAIFVDGRYTLQAQAQVAGDLFEQRHLVNEPPDSWLGEHAASGMRIGFDPWLHTSRQVEKLREQVGPAGATLVAVEANPVDRVWADRPAPPLSPITPHPLEVAGRGSAEKRGDVAEALRKARLDAAVLSAPDSIAWLLNVRGGDVECTPLPLSFAIVHQDGRVAWFLDTRKVGDDVRGHVGDGVEIAERSAFLPALDGLRGKRVRTDAATAAFAIDERLRAAGATVVAGEDPCALPKARKNAAELEGARAAHRRDGAAVCRFLAWLEREGSNGQLGEIAASDRLEAFRRESPEFRDLSFHTISGAGPNGAIVHYRSSPETERKITPGELYLVDSGAQYPDGTTDITRTVAIGPPPAEAARHFTLVLKGHVAIARARFPVGTGGIQLDALARRALWEHGLDYDHGTGHGVGSYLSVHEGPQRMARNQNGVPLEAGMIVSNEPGYYKTGAYGIRIENLVVVTPLQIEGGERPMFGFETLTLVPIDRRLVRREMLTDDEAAWLNDYHARVRKEISPRVDEQTRAWLEAATAPI